LNKFCFVGIISYNINKLTIKHMPKIFVVRHGQDQDNANHILNGHRDNGLTDLGHAQARETAQRLKGEKIDKAYCSPLKRCIETAEEICQQLGLPAAEIMADLIERDFGMFTGRPAADISILAENMITSDGINYFLTGEGVEEFPDCYKRAQKVLAYIKQQHPNENVLLATHGDFGKMLRAAFYGWEWERGIMTPYFANTEVLILE
jgi:probable phosphoglycerate mutase